MVTARPPRKQPLEDEEELNDENTINVLVPLPKNKRRKHEEVDTSDEAKVKTPSPKKRKILPVRVKDGEDDKPSSSRPVVEIPAARRVTPKKPAAVGLDVPSSAKTKHRRFDSEEPTEEVFSTAREAVTEDREDDQSAEDEDEDSDDEAPEAIGMQEAADTVKSREKDAAKAVQEQKSASRQKRKERDEALRKHAESTKKRKAKPKVVESIEQEVITVESSDEEDETGPGIDAMEEEEDEIIPTKMTNSKSLPDLLPLEFLQDDDPNEILAIEEQPSKVSKKTKFKDLLEKKPKDRRIGGTTYRVTKVQSKNLAPKAAHNARLVKESWLQGRSGKKVDPNRKAFSKGFFKK